MPRTQNLKLIAMSTTKNISILFFGGLRPSFCLLLLKWWWKKGFKSISVKNWKAHSKVEYISFSITQNTHSPAAQVIPAREIIFRQRTDSNIRSSGDAASHACLPGPALLVARISHWHVHLFCFVLKGFSVRDSENCFIVIVCRALVSITAVLLCFFVTGRRIAEAEIYLLATKVMYSARFSTSSGVTMETKYVPPHHATAT